MRDRLLEFSIPFTEHDKEDSPRIGELLTQYGQGSPRTPTIVIGDNERVLIEPKVQELDDAVRAAGYAFTSPVPIRFSDAVAARSVPDFKLPTARGGELELGRLRGSGRPVLFFAHNHTCRPCQGYARQLASLQTTNANDSAYVLIVLQDTVERAREWTDEFVPTAETLADMDGAIKRLYASYFGVRPEGVFALALDATLAPRIGSYAPDAGGLAAPPDLRA